MHKRSCTLVSFCYKSVIWLQFLLGYILCEKQTFNSTLGLAAVIKQNRTGTSARGFKYSTLAVK